MKHFFNAIKFASAKHKFQSRKESFIDAVLSELRIDIVLAFMHINLVFSIYIVQLTIYF